RSTASAASYQRRYKTEYAPLHTPAPPPWNDHQPHGSQTIPSAGPRLWHPTPTASGGYSGSDARQSPQTTSVPHSTYRHHDCHCQEKCTSLIQLGFDLV